MIVRTARTAQSLAAWAVRTVKSKPVAAEGMNLGGLSFSTKSKERIMKTKITLAMACFIGFVLCSAAVAYYPMLIVRECPHCKAHVVQEETVSGNTIGAKFYTDGRS